MKEEFIQAKFSREGLQPAGNVSFRVEGWKKWRLAAAAFTYTGGGASSQPASIVVQDNQGVMQLCAITQAKGATGDKNNICFAVNCPQSWVTSGTNGAFNTMVAASSATAPLPDIWFEDDLNVLLIALDPLDAIGNPQVTIEGYRRN